MTKSLSEVCGRTRQYVEADLSEATRVDLSFHNCLGISVPWFSVLFPDFSRCCERRKKSNA